jgi:hypothetical protein
MLQAKLGGRRELAYSHGKIGGARPMSDTASPIVPFPRRSPLEPAPLKRERPRGLPPGPGQPTDAQRAWLACGLDQPGGKLPLFDRDGKRVDARTIRSCIEQGWAERWFANPLKPDWLVCRLTDSGRALIAET